MFFALSILFFVIFLLKPLSALSRDFVSYSVVVACNYVITSTSILFKALFHSQFVNNWRKSLTETFLLNFLSFFNVRSCPSSHFFNSIRSCLLWGLDCESLLIRPARCIYIYIYIYTLQVIQVNHFHLYIIQSTTLIQLKRPTITLSKWKSQEKKSPELEDASTEEGHNITLVAEVEKKNPNLKSVSSLLKDSVMGRSG